MELIERGGDTKTTRGKARGVHWGPNCWETLNDADEQANRARHLNGEVKG